MQPEVAAFPKAEVVEEPATIAGSPDSRVPGNLSGSPPGLGSGLGRQAVETSSSRWSLASVILCSMFLMLLIFVVVLVSPPLLARWRLVEAKAEAEAAYLRRQAENRADAEDAERMLNLLDRRVKLISLGFREVVRKVTPAVVNVTNLATYHKDETDPLLREAPVVIDPETERQFRQLGVGSGLIVRPGYVLTNHHVVRNATRIRITFASGRSVGIPVTKGVKGNLWSDLPTDLAVIHIPDNVVTDVREDLNVTVVFADSERDVQRGDLVLAVGSPLGLKQTVTHGIISAKGRLLDRESLVEYIQTDAPINFGNSGGPLFDQFGRVAGINVAIATNDKGSPQGIGFVIPSNTVKKVFEHLVEKGEVLRGYLGILMTPLNRKELEQHGLQKLGGVRVTKVVSGQAAAKAGILAGDIIVKFNNQPLGTTEPGPQLRIWVVDSEVNQPLPVEILRNGQRRILEVRLGKLPAELQ
jgi:serine protease Do